jgi:antitoxin VapB
METRVRRLGVDIVALSIKDPRTEQLARQLASRTGERIATATRRALEERLKRLGAGGARQVELRDVLAGIRRRVQALPVVNARSTEEFLGYGLDGLPG